MKFLTFRLLLIMRAGKQKKIIEEGRRRAGRYINTTGLQREANR